MFCTSLRRRKSFASVVNSLTYASSLGLRENDLKTHDIAIPLPSTANPHTPRQLRVLLLSPSAVTENAAPSTIQRIQRFASLTGGKDVVIVFLLSLGDDTNQDASAAGMLAYTKLQAEMMSHVEIPAIPLLPLSKLDCLVNLLKSHHAALAAPRPKPQRSNTTTFDLLRQCSVQPPLDDHAAFLVTDLFTDLRDLARACTGVSQSPTSSNNMTKGMDPRRGSQRDTLAANTQGTEDGSALDRLEQLRGLQGDAVHTDLVEFWNGDYAV